MRTKTIKVTPEIYRRLKNQKGHNGCLYFNDVLDYLLTNEENTKSLEGEKK